MRKLLIMSLALWATGTAMPAKAVSAVGDTLNCDTLPELANGRRGADHGPDQMCFLWDGSTANLAVYLPITERPSTYETVAQFAKSTLEQTLRVYRDNGFMPVREQPAIRVWFLTAPGPDGVAADAFAESATDACVIRMWPSAFDVDEGTTPEERRKIVAQILAHEVFHCVQSAQLDKPSYGLASYWWMEGSAVWASSVVFPSYDREYIFTSHYHQHQILFDQCDPEILGNLPGDWRQVEPMCGNSWGIYATALFFQDMANQKGNRAVFNLLQSLPDTTNQLPQYHAFAGTWGMDEIFETFAQDYMDKAIADPGHPGGRSVAQPEPEFADTFAIDDRDSITLSSTPLVIYAYKLIFKPGHSYTVSGLNTHGRFRISYRTADQGDWQTGSNEPITFNAECSGETVTVLTSSVEATPEVYDFQLQIEAADCCTCSGPAPQCVAGNWTGNESPRWDLFQRFMAAQSAEGGLSGPMDLGDVTVKVESADLKLNVAPDGQFNASSKVHFGGEGSVSGMSMRVDAHMQSVVTGRACRVEEGKLCMQYSGVSGPSKMIITTQVMGPMTMPIPVSGFAGSQEFPYTCDANTLTIKATVPMDPPIELPLQYHR